MKYFFLIILSALTSQLFRASLGRSKDKSKIKNKTKKDGPLSWNNLAYDGVLESLLKNERQQKSLEVQDNKSSKVQDMNSYSSMISGSHIKKGKPAYTFLTTNTKVLSEAKSENQKSKTFRTVSPLEDSTKDQRGKKYSSIYKRVSRLHAIHPGYYGGSRLTR
jgi:hypothetical protein